jgi:hypothetical protein
MSAKKDGNKGRSQIAVVGGGIAGLYATYLLAKQGFSVQLFELNERRLGGKIATRKYPEAGPTQFWAEFGPMRFELDLQPRFLELCEHLGIPFTSFSPTAGPLVPTEYEMTEVERSFDSISDLHEWAMLQMFFGHERIGKTDVKKTLRDIDRSFPPKSQSSKAKAEAAAHSGKCQLAWLRCYSDRRLFIEETEHVNAATPKRDIVPAKSISGNLTKLRKNQRLFGEESTTAPLLRDIGLWHALSEVITPGALAKIRDSGTFYHCIANNPSAVEWGIFWLRQASVLGSLYTFRSDGSPNGAPDGISTLVTRLESRLREFEIDGRVTITRGAKVVEIAPVPDSTDVVLKFEQIARNPDHCTEHAILALPQSPLAELQGPFPKAVKDRINGVEPLHLLKAFVITKKPWWDPHLQAQSYAWRVPTRELHFFRAETLECPRSSDRAAECTCKSKNGMIMLYCDQPAIHYWDLLLSAAEKDHLIWKSLDSGGEPLDVKKELNDDSFGVLDLLIRRLLMVPYPGLATKVNLLERQILSRLKDAEIEKQIKAQRSSLLGFSQQIVEFLKSSRGGQRSPVGKAIKQAVELELDQPMKKWFESLSLTLHYRDKGYIAPADVAEVANDVLAYGIRDWSAKPFGGAAHLWRPGYSAALSGNRVRDPLHGFVLNSQSVKHAVPNVHICGEAYSSHQGFIEGALDTAQVVVDRVIGANNAKVPRHNLEAENGEKAAEQATERQDRRNSKWYERLDLARPQNQGIPDPQP